MRTALPMRRLLAILLPAAAIAPPTYWQKFLDGRAGARYRCGAWPRLARNHSASTCGPGSPSLHSFYKHVCKQPVVSDKVAAHSYYSLYGLYLVPLQQATGRVKLLEIGLGCDMHEVGASATIWKTLLPAAEIWLAEYDASCVEAMQRKGRLDGLNMLTGDQGSPAVLGRWVQQSGGGFDVVIDDGGHSNSQILTTFAALWPQVKPGGFYFMEDLQAGRQAGWPQTTPEDRRVVVSDVLQGWIEELLIGKPRGRPDAARGPRMPIDVEFISCQREMCVIAKTARETPLPLPPLSASGNLVQGRE